MTEREIDPVDIVYAISGALRPVVGKDDFEIVPYGWERALEICADEWTLHIEWAVGIAWLAIDVEPGSQAEFDSARRQVMNEVVELAFGSADTELGGFLVEALIRSRDPFSMAFAAAISASRSAE